MFVASCSGSAYGLDRATGDFVWTYDTRKDGPRAEFHGTPIVTPALIVTVTDNRRRDGRGHVYAFERRSGTVRWKRPLAVGVMSDLVRVDDMLYYATLTEQVEALHLADGQLAWTHDTGGSNAEFYPTSTPLVTPDRVIFGGVDGTLRAIDRASGELRWTRKLPARVSAGPARLGDTLYVGTADGKLHRVRLEDGAVEGSRDLGRMPFGQPVVLEDRLIFLTVGGGAFALGPRLDEPLWESVVDSEWAAFRRVVVDDLVLAGADDGKLYALRWTDGSHVWSRDFGGPVTSLTAVDDGLYVGTSKGIVFSCGWVVPQKSAPSS